jgi:hypothetical protein
MAVKDPEFVSTFKKYGPSVGANIVDVEEAVALSQGKKPRDKTEMMGQKMEAMAGRPDARKKNEQLIKEAEELANQYKREARGTSSSIPDRLRSMLGFKHGGTVSTTKPNKKQNRW